MPPIETRFKKGQSGNPGGKIPDSPELKRLKNLTREELANIGNLVIAGDLKAIKKIKDNPNSPALRAMIASVALRVIGKGDMHSLDILLNRLVGKVKDELEVSGSTGPLIQLSMPSNGREAPTTPLLDRVQTDTPATPLKLPELTEPHDPGKD